MPYAVCKELIMILTLFNEILLHHSRSSIYSKNNYFTPGYRLLLGILNMTDFYGLELKLLSRKLSYFASVIKVFLLKLSFS